MKLHAPSAQRNRDPILEVLLKVWSQPTRVLEVASGTGQHVVHFAAAMPHVVWQPSDVDPARLASVRGWMAEARLDNVLEPVELDAGGLAWPRGPFGGVLAINVVHMVAEPVVRALLRGAGAVLEPGGRLVVYECCTYQGKHVSESNARFDQWLRDTTEGGHVYEYDDLVRWAAEADLVDPEIHWLPANNQCLVWTSRPRAT